MFTVVVLWLAALGLLRFRLPLAGVTKAALISGCMALVVHESVQRISAIPAASIGVIVGVGLYLIGLRISRVLGTADRDRILLVKDRVPAGVRRIFDAGVNWLLPAPVVE